MDHPRGDKNKAELMDTISTQLKKGKVSTYFRRLILFSMANTVSIHTPSVYLCVRLRSQCHLYKDKERQSEYTSSRLILLSLANIFTIHPPSVEDWLGNAIFTQLKKGKVSTKMSGYLTGSSCYPWQIQLQSTLLLWKIDHLYTGQEKQGTVFILIAAHAPISPHPSYFEVIYKP